MIFVSFGHLWFFIPFEFAVCFRKKEIYIYIFRDDSIGRRGKDRQTDRRTDGQTDRQTDGQKRTDRNGQTET